MLLLESIDANEAQLVHSIFFLNIVYECEWNLLLLCSFNWLTKWLHYNHSHRSINNNLSLLVHFDGNLNLKKIRNSGPYFCCVFSSRLQYASTNIYNYICLFCNVLLLRFFFFRLNCFRWCKYNSRIQKKSFNLLYIPISVGTSWVGKIKLTILWWWTNISSDAYK